MRLIHFSTVFFLLLFPLLVLGTNPDSLIEQRNIQLQDINSYRAAMADSSTESLLPLLEKMNALIEKDGQFLDLLGAEMIAQDTALSKANAIAAEYEGAKAELAKYEEYKLYAMIGAGALIFIFLLIIIIQASAKSKLKKKIKKMGKQLAETEEKDQLIVKLNNDLQALDKDHKLSVSKMEKDHALLIKQKDEDIEKYKKEQELAKTVSPETDILKKTLAEKESAMTALKHDAEHSKMTVENLRNETDALKKQLEGITNKHLSELAEKESLTLKLQEDLTKAKKANNELELQMFHLQNSKGIEEDLVKIKTEHEQKMLELTTQKLTLENDLQQIRKDYDELKNRFDEETRNRQEQISSIHQSEDNTAALERLKSELLAEREKHITEIENLRKDNEKLRQEHEDEIRRIKDQKHISIDKNDTFEDINVLKKELEEERKIRMEMQTLFEELLKRK